MYIYEKKMENIQHLVALPNCEKELRKKSKQPPLQRRVHCSDLPPAANIIMHGNMLSMASSCLHHRISKQKNIRLVVRAKQGEPQPKPKPSLASWIASSILSSSCSFNEYSGRSSWLKHVCADGSLSGAPYALWI